MNSILGGFFVVGIIYKIAFHLENSVNIYYNKINGCGFRPANTVADMPGDCYTVMVKGQERHLFFERSDPRFPSRFGRWFVEVETK